MNLMNEQAGRTGKLQLEVDQGQLRTLAWALGTALPHARTADELASALEMLRWLEHRSIRRWGVSIGAR